MNIGNIERYEMFLATVECGSMNAAAERLGYSQPAISQAMLALEVEFGLRLLIRSKQGARPTEDGERLIGPIRGLMNAGKRLSETVNELNGIAAGTIRLGTISSVSMQWLPWLIEDFQKLYPRIGFRLYANNCYGEIAEDVENGGLDLGFYSAPVPGALRFVPLVKDPMLAVVPPGHPLAREQSVTADMLRDEPFIIYGSNGDADMIRALRQLHIAPKVSHILNDDLAIIAMIAHGHGVSIMPALILQELGARVVALPLDPPCYRELGLISPQLRYITPAAAKFSDFAVRRLRKDS